VKDLQGFDLYAEDGDVGSVEEFYFDDEKWVVRYLIVNTGNWLAGRLVLISPVSIADVDWKRKKIHVRLNREQVEKSPDIDLKKPVSRQQESRLYKYYAWPYYWGGIGMWGGAMYPGDLFLMPEKKGVEREEIEDQDSHLRSTKEVIGYRIQAQDGEIGHLDDFVVEEKTWAIRYFIVDTRNWLPGKKVILSTKWIDKVVWRDYIVQVGLTRKGVEEAPEFNPQGTFERYHEIELHKHYNKPTYW
jgi:sporulation protein YlmC with PRC-barrel domain